jgi:hypothetical protein
MFSLEDFVRESNRIEGIATVSPSEVGAHEKFLTSPVTVESLIALVGVLQPNAMFRDNPRYQRRPCRQPRRAAIRPGDQDQPRSDPSQPEHLGSAHPV